MEPFLYTLYYIHLHRKMVFKIVLLLISFSLFTCVAPAIIDAKPLSPVAKVNIDIVNHVDQALHAHGRSLHHNWRDYTIIFLLIIVLGTCCLTCCGAAIICIYRRLLAQLVRGSASSTDGRRSTTTIPFSIT
jgi:hypothetical protein